MDIARYGTPSQSYGVSHMGLHSVSRHSAQVNAPRLNPSRTGQAYLINLPRRDGRL